MVCFFEYNFLILEKNDFLCTLDKYFDPLNFCKITDMHIGLQNILKFRIDNRIEFLRYKLSQNC